MTTSNKAPALSDADVLHVARLAQLDPTPEQVSQYREQLAAILSYVDRLSSLDLAGVEPMSSPIEATIDLDSPASADAPAPPLPRAELLAMAPATTHGHFVRVPKVLGDGGAA